MTASSKHVLTWAEIRPWKTPYTIDRRLGEVCDELARNGLEPGAIVEGLFLAAYDTAAAPGCDYSTWSLFTDMKQFGEDGLASLPQLGASAMEPDWKEMFDLERRGHEAYAAIWGLCGELRRGGVGRKDITASILRCTATHLRACTEEARRYWFKQFQVQGAKGKDRASGTRLS